MSVLRRLLLWMALLATLPTLAACGPSVNAIEPQPTIAINPGFQKQVSPIPTIPPYRCGAWASNNSPGRNATIMIYARLFHNNAGVGGKAATAVVHFRGFDFTIPQTATSDDGGYVSFTLNLQGRQPAQVPATVDVTFTGLPGGSLTCSQAFFTPK